MRRTKRELLELVDGIPATDVAAIGPGSTVPDIRLDEMVRTFEEFYRQELASLVVLARVLAGRALAEDVAQEAMLAACSRWDEVQGYDSPVGWVRTVCMRKATSLLRRRSAEQRLLRQLGSFRAVAPSAPGEDERFWSAVRALPRRQAQVVALHYALDLPVAEVAATLGCAEGAVKAHLSRARAALAVELDLSEGDES